MRTTVILSTQTEIVILSVRHKISVISALTLVGIFSHLINSIGFLYQFSRQRSTVSCVEFKPLSQTKGT